MSEALDPVSERLHATTAKLFWSKGYAAASTRELTARMRIRPGSQ